MIPCTITYGHLRMDRDGAGSLTIARTDKAESVRLSRTEWAFVQKQATIWGYPLVPPTDPPPPESP